MTEFEFLKPKYWFAKHRLAATKALWPIDKKPMKRLLFLLIFISPSFLFAQILDFNFCDSQGHSYQSKNFNAQIKKEYNSEYNLKLILVETPDLKDSLFKKQFEILNSMDAEELNLIYVSASFNNEDKDGYHTSINTARTLMNSKPGFRIRILNANGKVIKESKDILQSDSLKGIFLR